MHTPEVVDTHRNLRTTNGRPYNYTRKTVGAILKKQTKKKDKV